MARLGKKEEVSKIKSMPSFQMILIIVEKCEGAGERGFEVSKSGDTRVGLVGFPSGKLAVQYGLSSYCH